MKTDVRTFMVVSHRSPFRMRNISNKFVDKMKIHILVLIIPPPPPQKGVFFFNFKKKKKKKFNFKKPPPPPKMVHFMR